MFRRFSALVFLLILVGIVFAQASGGAVFCKAQKQICQPGLAESSCCCLKESEGVKDCCVSLSEGLDEFTFSESAGASTPHVAELPAEGFDNRLNVPRRADPRLGFSGSDPPPRLLQLRLALLQIRLI